MMAFFYYYYFMNLNSIRIVLVGTTHPGNIGASARAMKTMGFHRLYLVEPQVYPHLNAYEMAAGADDILEQAVVTSSLAEALKGCHLILATSARVRNIALPTLTPATQAEMIQQLESHSEIAIVFGRERTGLTNDELLHCHYRIEIPTNAEYRSLNLAQAVQIITYEIRQKYLSAVSPYSGERDKRATAEEVERFYTHLQEVLIATQFLKEPTSKRLMQRLRRLFNRTQLEQVEVNILRGILTSVVGAQKSRKS